MGQGLSRASAIRIGIFLVIGAGVGLAIYFSPTYFAKKPEPVVKLKTGGTASVSFMMYGWNSVYKKEKGVDLDYMSVGSTTGVDKMIAKEIPIAFTHSALSDKKKKEAQDKGGEIVQIPVVLCAVVPVYNVKELENKPPLKFTGEVLTNIFLGNIDYWDDPALKAINDEVKDLPHTKIQVVHREDSSGTTQIFANYLSTAGDKAADAWKKKEMPPIDGKFRFKAGVGKTRNEGVANYVRETNGAIGYVDLLHVRTGKKLDYGAVQNKANRYVHAEPENMKAAAKHLADDITADLTFSLINKPGDEAYPICGAIWAVCYQNQPADKQKMVVDFLRWVNHDGQELAARRSFSPIPEDIVKRVDEKLATIKTQ